jgi:hypothetical protein
MTELPNPEEFVLSEVLRSGLDDWVQMSDVASVLQHFARITDSAIGRRVALRIIPLIVHRGLMKPGTVTAGKGFEPYSNDAALELLDRLWPADHLPHLGELPLWLALTDKGKEWLEVRGLG